ncbi:MAG: SIS domain-containing protein [Leptospiraceae bacterium]|nr:SIS domain-containing protein [Leptospiraceae bacterium]
MGNYSDKIARQIEESIAVKNMLLKESDSIENAGLLCALALKNNKKLLLCGNGGSAADAQHIAAELVIRFKGGNERRGLPAMTLSPDPSTITACGNDYGFEKLFSRGVEAFGQPGDVLVGISTSGNSQNVLYAIEEARKKEMKIVLLLGGSGGKMKGMGDVNVTVPSSVTARIQESHITIGHIICSIIEKELFNLD